MHSIFDVAVAYPPESTLARRCTLRLDVRGVTPLLSPLDPRRRVVMLSRETQDGSVLIRGESRLARCRPRARSCFKALGVARSRGSSASPSWRQLLGPANCPSGPTHALVGSGAGCVSVDPAASAAVASTRPNASNLTGRGPRLLRTFFLLLSSLDRCCYIRVIASSRLLPNRPPRLATRRARRPNAVQE